MTVNIGLGSIVVESPEEWLKSELVRFRRMNDGSGEYESLFSYSSERDMLVTMPGFMKRIVGKCGKDDRIKDLRVKMPAPDMDWASGGLSSGWQAWHNVVESAVSEGGGIVSVPDIFGVHGMAAAIIRAYPRDRLAERGAPICLVATEDSSSARALADKIRVLVPERDVGICAGGFRSDSEDVVVAAYGTMRDVMLSAVGVFIGVIGGRLTDKADEKRAEAVSAVRNAARWGIVSTPIGGNYEPDMAEEGLFGPLVASASYNDAVKGSVGMPVTVCWLPVPRPMAPDMSAPLDVLEKMAHDENAGFVRMLGDIVHMTPPEVGCVVRAGRSLVGKFNGHLQGVVRIDKSAGEKLRKTMLDDLSGGAIRKALVEDRFFKCKVEQVLVTCSCGGADSVYNIPWGAKTKEAPDRKLYMVDFRHDWDVHNGRPGRLARNDDARKLRYRELGFSQILCDIEELPFL